MEQSQAESECPWCGYIGTSYAVTLHIEEHHPEGASPFVTDDVRRQYGNGESGQQQQQQQYESVYPPERSHPINHDASSSSSSSSSSSPSFSRPTPRPGLGPDTSSRHSPAAMTNALWHETNASNKSTTTTTTSPQITHAVFGGGDQVHYAECPVPGCGEILLESEMSSHLEFHISEQDDTAIGDSTTRANEPMIRSAGHDGVVVVGGGGGGCLDSDDFHLGDRRSAPHPVSRSSRVVGKPARHVQEARRGHHDDYMYDDDDDEEEEDYDEKDDSASSSRFGGGGGRYPSVRRNGGATVQAWKDIFTLGRSHHSKRKTSRSSTTGHEDGVVDAVVSDPPRKRLGRSALGRYAHEDQMPDWLVRLLREQGQVVGRGIIPVLQQLLHQSPSTAYAYLCHPCVQHISKLKKEGGFCGYRNIQMLTSYLIGTKSPLGTQHFGDKVPSVFQIQDFIESAWDMGINAQGRLETGGVRGTRKYIGTPEAQAVFVSLRIPCDAQGFKTRGQSETLLFDAVESYFESGDFDPEARIRATTLPPIYFQHAGHSMTIIGIERYNDKSRSLLVFDPMFHDASSITRLVGKRFQHKYPDSALKSYRRDSRYLKKYWEFEILKLVPPASTTL